ncbi:hypothetical protein [Leptospira borgpetersenii]|uniref:PF07614 family protein n=1 Tax=Leptospira borgpetersenii str. Brem 328 TaxID=1049780 RepID=A0ABC9SGK0_LEPBO|nr:hypothetical protein [Leptospira borgpetersenii]EMN13249.1 hypothetical protein LEP1GSC055_0533 [Leptospira borgpetersenii str. Brem 307]EMN16847.1 hypothetical protein LEP1GSC056_2532 [Leptospira borgpetersenii str. Brem 328]
MSKPVLNQSFGGGNQTQNFLKVKKINEVVSYYLNDRLTHSVYKAIVTQTSHKNVKSQNLFQVESRVPEASELTTTEVVFHIKRLLEDEVVLQFAYFYIDPATSDLKLKPCYVAYTDAEPGDLTRIYLSLIDLSINSILSYLENKPPLGKEVLWEDLETDFKGEDLQKLKLFFNPESFFQAPNISVPLNPEYVKDMLVEITDGLIKKGRIREIPEFGYLVIKTKELQTLFELVDEFHFKKVFPKYKWALSDSFAAISHEERMHTNDPSATPTTLFGKKRAKAVGKVIESDSERKSKRKFMGVELIQSLSEEVESSLKISYQEQIRNRFHEMTDHLSKQTGRWDRLVLFIPDEEFKTYPAGLKKLFTEDSHIAYSPWETKGITMHSFMRVDVETVKSVVKSLTMTANVDAWKILSIRNLIELNEDAIQTVFKDEEFVKNYGKVLRKGYVKYFPWYFGILDFVGVAKLIQDIFFQAAKEKIRSEQSLFKSRNRDIAFKLEQKEIQEKLKEDEKIKSLEQKSKLSEALNRYYFERNIPPVLKDILYEVPGYSPELIQQIIERDKFVLIPDSDPAKDKADSILIYPEDESFRFRAKEIHRVLSEKKKNLEFKLSNKEEDFQKEKIIKTLKYLDSWFSAKPEISKGAKSSASVSSNEDPYENFRKEIIKIKGKEKISL